MQGLKTTKSGKIHRVAALALIIAAAVCVSPRAFAACTSPAGNPGDIVYGSNNIMAYCNGTVWVNMGTNLSIGFGTLTTGDFCTATSGTQISCTTATVNLSSQASGTLQAAQFPALTGDVTTPGGSLVTTIGTNKVTMSDIAQIPGLSVLGVTGASTANVGPITGIANQTLVVNNAGTALAFGALNIGSSAAVTGVLLGANGGTGVANTGDTITLGGNMSTGGAFTISGAYSVTLTATATTSLTLPTSGTIVATTTGSPAQGDLLYYNGTAWTDLAHGTSGQFLETLGASANPAWATVTLGTGSITGTTQYAVLLGNGASGITSVGPGAIDTVLVGEGASANPQFSAAPVLSGSVTTLQSIGTTSTNGIVLQNTTAATSTVNQFSPRVHFTGQGWETNGPASQSVDMIEELQPVVGTANPSGSLVWSSSVNGTTPYTALMTLTTGGNVGIGTASPNGALEVLGTSAYMTGSGSLMDFRVSNTNNNPTGKYIQIESNYDNPSLTSTGYGGVFTLTSSSGFSSVSQWTIQSTSAMSVNGGGGLVVGHNPAGCTGYSANYGLYVCDLAAGVIPLIVNTGSSHSTSIPVAEFQANDAIALTVAGTGNVGIGTASPNANALLQVYSTTKGFLPPLLTTAQETAMGTSLPTGLVVYNTDGSHNELESWNGTAWEAVGASAIDAGGSNTQLQYNNGGDLGGTAGLTWDNVNDALTLTALGTGAATALTITGPTLTGTTSYPILSLAQTWNNAGGNFTSLKENITNTASVGTSKLIDLQVGGVSAFNVTGAGYVGVGSSSPQGTLDVEGSNGILLNAGSVSIGTAGTTSVPSLVFSNCGSNCGILAPS